MALPEWFKRAWARLTDETLPDMQAKIEALEARVEQLEQRGTGGYGRVP